MNYTKAKIFNMALKNLGVSIGVQSAAQGGRNTIVLQEYYDTALYKTLNDYDWGFANCYQELTPALNSSIHPDFAYVYDYPNDCLKIRELFLKIKLDENNKAVNIPLTPNPSPSRGEGNKRVWAFEIGADAEGKKIIYADISPAIARFTKLITNETLFPPEFVSALSWNLAFLSAASITGTRSKTSDCLQIYKQMLKEAMVSDANEQKKYDDFENEYMEARN